MKNVCKVLTLALVALVLFVAPVHAQATLPTFTLTQAVVSTSVQTIAVSSATNFAKQYVVFIDAEAMRVISISGNIITVERGAGSRATTHASGASGYVGPANYFSTYDRYGSCTATQELVLPVVNTDNARIFNCSSSKWLWIAWGTNDLVATPF
jgi:hypothetical protein